MPTGKLVPQNPNDPLQRVALSILKLKKGIAAIRQAMLTPTFPVYPDGAPVTPLETQIAFFGDTPMYYRDGAWSPFGGSSAPGTISWATLLGTGVDIPFEGAAANMLVSSGGSDHFATNDPDTFSVEDGNLGIVTNKLGFYLAHASLGVDVNDDLTDLIIPYINFTGGTEAEDIGMQLRSPVILTVPRDDSSVPTNYLFAPFQIIGDSVTLPGAFEIWSQSSGGYADENLDHSLTVIRVGDPGAGAVSGYD